MERQTHNLVFRSYLWNGTRVSEERSRLLFERQEKRNFTKQVIFWAVLAAVGIWNGWLIVTDRSVTWDGVFTNEELIAKYIGTQ